MAKSIKSRYKICFQTFNKVWIYKNSRLRHFYNIRNKVVLQQGQIAKKLIITKSMKWTIIRRKMVPYIRNKNRFRYQYKNLFFNKQQLKNFYGGLREYKLRNIFKKTWNVELFYRRNIFIGALEQRLNMVLFRMRLLPTIFTSTQFIMHKGIYVNESLITLPSYRVKLGEIVSIPQDQWFIFYNYLHKRVLNRYVGESILYWRKECILKKIQYYRLSNKKIFIKNLLFLKKNSDYKKNFLILKKNLKLLIKYNEKKIKKNSLSNYYKKELNFLKILNIMVHEQLFVNILKVDSIIKNVHLWNKKSYTKEMHFIFYKLLYIKKTLKKFTSILLSILTKSFIEKIIILLQKNINKEFLLKIKEEKNISNIDFINSLKKAKNIYLNNFYENYLIEEELKNKNSLYKTWNNSLKKTLRYKVVSIKYNKYMLYLLRKLKYKKIKNKVFKSWCTQTHWYTPNYLEIDYCTLRSIFVYYPESHEVFFGFPCSFDKIISFYKERAL